jgi:sialate O-acetylesterase
LNPPAALASYGVSMSPFRLLMPFAVLAATAMAAPELAPLFQDHAVLQRDKPVAIWGRAAPGEHLSVAFAGQKLGATADPAGRWIVVLGPLSASSLGADLVVAGKTTLTLHDLLVGEVWLCAGGSGMEYAAPDGTRAPNPLIRGFKVARQEADAPMETVGGDWKPGSAATAADLTTVGYYFARDLFDRLGVPVGVIDCSASPSSIEAWMSPAALAIVHRPATEGASRLFNGMIHPLLPYAIRGIAWYQGESDVGHAADYAAEFPALVTAWRSHFGADDLPFLWVQLGGPGSAAIPGEPWARFREAQSAALSLPGTGQAVAVDVGDSGRLEIARRLALLAKAKAYSIPVDFSGPTYSDSAVEGAAIRVHFNFAGEGLTASGKPLQSFEIAGVDRVFHSASASIQGDTVVVRSPAVRQPVAVRYAWSAAAEGNLYNGAGLPAPPFRSDDW